MSGGLRSTSRAAGLYVHVPFCSFVCPYCDFSVERVKAGRIANFVDHLIKEIKLTKDFDFPIETIYFGGGTPSLLSKSAMVAILSALDQHLDLLPDVRLHMEANPEDVTETFVETAQDLGVKFLSLGVQSFEDQDLKSLGRRHTRKEALAALDMAQDGDFETVSVDLMFGLPNQERGRWLAQLDLLAEQGVEHVSCYQLNIKPGTLFAKRAELGRFLELSDDARGDYFGETHERLSALGFAAYEVSNFATDLQHQSQHNKKYWDHSPYLGFGPSAHSFDGEKRFWNYAFTDEWVKGLVTQDSGVAGYEILSAKNFALEEIMLGLRQPQGLNIGGFENRHGINLLEESVSRIENLKAAKLIWCDDGFLKPTVEGLAVADSLAAEIGYFL